jgi:hypothetical protein
MDRIMGVRTIVFLLALTWLSNCGGTATSGSISISPNEPFVLSVTRNLIVGDEIIPFSAPNTAFQIKINNAGNSNPLTILGLTLNVDGPKGNQIVAVDPIINLFKLNGSNFVPYQRAFFAEVPAYQASYCMDKVTFLKETDYATARLCAEIAADNTKIPDHGVSAVNTIEGYNGTACCPNTGSNGDLEGVFVLIGSLQTYGEGEIVPTSISLSISARFQGFYGTFAQPISNYSSQVNFTARAN